MKRNYIPFIAGMSTMLLLVGLVGASLAGETRPPAVPQSGTLNGQVAYGEAGVALFGKEQVPAGAAWTTEDGAQIPTVLTYTDENGEDHYFISAETAAEVLDMVYGAVYREDLNCIDFGTEAAVDAEGNPRLDGNGQPIYWTGAEFFSRRTTQNEDGTERIVAIGDQKAEIQVGDGTSVMLSTNTVGEWVICRWRRVTSLGCRAWMSLLSWYSSTAASGHASSTCVIWGRTVSGRKAVYRYSFFWKS